MYLQLCASRAVVAKAAAALTFVLGVPGTSGAAISTCIGPTGVGLCATATSPCIVASHVDVVPEAFLDCSGIDIQITAPAGGLTVTSGRFSLLARDLTVDQGRTIEATADPVVLVGFELSLSGSLSLAGRLVADNAGGRSSIAVQADGSITLSSSNPAISAVGTEESAGGGEVYLLADGAVTIGKSIYIHGKDGGDEDNINAGGLLLVQAGGNIAVNDEIRAYGRWYGGGDVRLYSGANVSINFDAGGVPKGTIVVEGKNLTADGGQIDIGAATQVLVSGPLLLGGGINNAGGEGAGGSAYISAGCGGVVIEDTVNLTGGLANGGTLIVDSDGPVTLSGSIDAESRANGGNGGVVLLQSRTNLVVSDAASINVDGHDSSAFGEDGQGGVVLLWGCTVDVRDTASAGAILTAKGASGGALGVAGGKTPVGSQEWSVHLGDKTLFDTTGAYNSGVVDVELAVKRNGYCSNNVQIACTLHDQCVFGCNAGTCSFPNPDTDGVNTQFIPVPIVNQNATVTDCSSVCN